MLYREIIAVFSQIHTKHMNTLCGQNVELLRSIYIQFYTRHFMSHCLAIRRVLMLI